MSPLENAIFLAGPTASGKSDAALILAEKLEGEIITVDSMQVYRGLDIGTAKPSKQEQTRVPHHLIDVADLDQTFDTGRFLGLARKAEQDILARGKTPIYCGGTGLYFKALISGLGEAPPRNENIRNVLEQTPLAELQRELKHSDPATYDKIDLKNPRRLIRALEVIRATGRPFSQQRSRWNDHPQPGKWFGLERERADLNERINARVDQMFEKGLVEETRRLLASGFETNQTAMQALGYRQVMEHLRGLRDLEDTIELVKLKTRQFAKRQMTWFKRQLSLTWIQADSKENASDVAEKMLVSLHPAHGKMNE